MEHNLHAAIGKMFFSWLLVGLSQMTPLQWVQMVAAVAATIYSIVQTYVLVRDRIIKRKSEVAK